MYAYICIYYTHHFKSEWRLFRLLSAKIRKGSTSSILELTVLVLKADSIVDSVLNFVKIELTYLSRILYSSEYRCYVGMQHRKRIPSPTLKIFVH